MEHDLFYSYIVSMHVNTDILKWFACFCQLVENSSHVLIVNRVFCSDLDSEFSSFPFYFFLQFYLEESKGRVDYQGYIFPRRRGNTVSDLPPICLIIFVKQVLEIRNIPLLNVLFDDQLEVY